MALKNKLMTLLMGALIFLLVAAAIIIVYYGAIQLLKLYSNTVYVNLTTIVLTIVIALFAAVQGWTSYGQYTLQKQITMQEKATNELEKAYGPLHTLLNNPSKIDANGIILNVNEKVQLDLIVSTYPFMFPREIKEYWRDNVQRKVVIVAEYHVPFEFRKKVNTEYDSRIKRYEKLFEKHPVT
jgi:hypothetical protein